MTRKNKLILVGGLLAVGLVSGFLLMGRTIPVSVDGAEWKLTTRALTVGSALRGAGINISPGDEVLPPEGTWLSKTGGIEVNRSRLVRIIVEPGGKLLEVETPLLNPQEILQTTGMNPGTDDLVSLNGRSIPLNEPIEQRGEIILQYKPAVQVLVNQNGEQLRFNSTSADLGAALWQAGLQLRAGDRLSLPVYTPLTHDLEVELRTGRSIIINADGITREGYSAAETVGEALAENGVALQDLDFSQPAESDPLPEDGAIRVVRVTEELLMEQGTIPYESESLADDTLEINTRKVITEGAVGIKASRVKVRFEDGVEVSRENLGEIVIAEAVKRVVHYGTKIVDKYLDTPDGPITYYMTANVVATSYSPCRSGVPGKCYTGTSYGLPVQKGVIGVTRAWYYMFRGSQIYVPGYGVGTIADIGYYPYSDAWIDLGYSDSDYVSWGATNVTIYFLSPPPPGFSGVLP